MVVNLTKTFTATTDRHLDTMGDEEGTTDRKHKDADPRIEIEKQSDTFHPSIALSESQATCSVANVNESFNDNENQTPQTQSDLDPTPGPTRYTLRMNEILVGNFIEEEKK